MKPPSAEEIEAVLKLDGNARYLHLIKRIADCEQAWGLWSDGWALVGNSDDEDASPLWPAREYAELCRIDLWRDYVPRAIPLAKLKDELLPRLREDGTLVAAFPRPDGKGVMPTAEDMLGRLRAHLATWYAEYD